LNQLWLNAALACIGATFDDDSQVVGIVVSVRKQADKVLFGFYRLGPLTLSHYPSLVQIALWTSNAQDEQAVRRIGRQLKEMLQLPASTKIGYQSHQDAMDANSSFNNSNRYEV